MLLKNAAQAETTTNNINYNSSQSLNNTGLFTRLEPVFSASQILSPDPKSNNNALAKPSPTVTSITLSILTPKIAVKKHSSGSKQAEVAEAARGRSID